MAELQIFHVFGIDYPDHSCWRLLDWARDRGAEEFSVFGILAQGGKRTAFDNFDLIADPHRRPGAPRRNLHELTPRMAELWALNDTTVEALRLAFPRGFFEYVPADAWFEDLVVYRAGELLLGVITHEGEGILRVDEEDRQELERRGLPYRTEGAWVGY